MTRLTYTGGLITSAGTFFNGSWAYFDTQTLVAGQSITVTINSNTITEPFTFNLYTTLANLRSAFAALHIIVEYDPPIYSPSYVTEASRTEIGRILFRVPELVTTLSASVIDSATSDVVYTATTSISPTSSSIMACLQPITGTQSMVIPEGLRTQWFYVLWTDTKLNTVDATGIAYASDSQYGNNADKIIDVDGTIYSVESAKPWINTPIMGGIGGVSQYQYYVGRYQPLTALEIPSTITNQKRT